MSFDAREKSRRKGDPITLYNFSGGTDKTTFAGRSLEQLLQSVTIIPGTTEFGYGTTRVDKVTILIDPETEAPIPTDPTPENYLADRHSTDFVNSIEDLLRRAPNLKHVSLVISWHGDDLRIGTCQIRPKMEYAGKDTIPYEWSVGPVYRGNAELVSYIAGKPAVGGAPSDRSVYEAIVFLKSKGLKVTLYPFITMDIEAGNSLPNPYGGASQPEYPWRGRITCTPAAGEAGTVDKTAAAATQVANFFGTTTPAHFGWNSGFKEVNYTGPANEWSFRRHILHIAQIAQAAGGVDDFLIGSEMIGMTTIRSDASTYPAVARLKTLAADVSGMLGSGTRISYAADWSEFHSHRPSDGSNDVFFHLDDLWSDTNIDFIGIDNYLPLSDWRNGTTHLDYVAGYHSIYDRQYLKTGIEGGENYDWYYTNDAARNSQTRTPITDGLGKPWVFRNKDIRNWWLNSHFNRPGGTESGSATTWSPESKPIVFTEIGCGAVDKGTNQPNKFIDPKSSESSAPYYSSGLRDDLIQRVFLESNLSYWRPLDGVNPTSSVYSAPMIDWGRISVWTWDARPHPTFPEQSDFWGDAGNWSTGHWLNGRLLLTDATITSDNKYLYTDAERPVEWNGDTYEPVPIRRGSINSTGNSDKTTLEIQTSTEIALAELFRVYPPSNVVTLVVLQGHYTDGEFLVVWTGKVASAGRSHGELSLQCEPIATSLRRPGLRRHYQYGCPHALYGPQCNADLNASTITATVESKTTTTITLPVGWISVALAPKHIGGMVKWINSSGDVVIRTILNVNSARVLTLSAAIPELLVGDSIQVVLGCNHQMTDCRDLHNNIHNFGGCPWIPSKNPLSQINNFY
jgi:hypothetical protein